MRGNFSKDFKRGKKELGQRYSNAEPKSLSVCFSPGSFTKRLITQKIPLIKTKFGFFSGINVNSALCSYSNAQHLEKLPNMYLDNDSIYESQYQELVNTILEKGDNKTFEFEQFDGLTEGKAEAELFPGKNFRLCGRFNKKSGLRAGSLLPQTLAKLRIKRPLKKEKFNVDGIQALGYQKISAKATGK